MENNNWDQYERIQQGRRQPEDDIFLDMQREEEKAPIKKESHAGLCGKRKNPKFPSFWKISAIAAIIALFLIAFAGFRVADAIDSLNSIDTRVSFDPFESLDVNVH